VLSALSPKQMANRGAAEVSGPTGSYCLGRQRLYWGVLKMKMKRRATIINGRLESVWVSEGAPEMRWATDLSEPLTTGYVRTRGSLTAELRRLLAARHPEDARDVQLFRAPHASLGTGRIIFNAGGGRLYATYIPKDGESEWR